MPETIFDGCVRSSGQAVAFSAPWSYDRLRRRPRTRDEVPDTCRVIIAPALRAVLAAKPRLSVGRRYASAGGSVEHGDAFAGRHRRCLRHGSGRKPLAFALGYTRSFDTCPSVSPPIIAATISSASRSTHRLMRADDDGRARDDDGDRDRASIARLASRFCPRQFSTVAFGVRVKPSRLPRHVHPTGFGAANELETKSRTLAESFLRPCFARRSPRHSIGLKGRHAVFRSFEDESGLGRLRGQASSNRLDGSEPVT